MAKLIQLCTEKSRKDECFTKGVWPAAGMGYVLVTDANKLLVIDGGETRGDAENLLSLLEKYADGKLVVDLWIITHGHGDHYGALRHIANDETLRARVDVVEFLAQTDIPVAFPEGDQASVKDSVKAFDRPLLKPHKDDIFTVDNLEIHILYTWENDPNVADAKSHNRLSQIFTVTDKTNGKRVMFVGDSTSTGPSTVRKSYDAEILKSDFLQLAHHGLDGGDIGFYRMVAPETVLIPCSLGGAKFIKCPETPNNYANRYIQDRALNVICACIGTVELEF